MADFGDKQYRYQSMKVIRGREAHAITKMVHDGWELDTQDQGKLRTELSFRREKKPTPWRLIAAGATAAVLAIAIAGGVAAFGSSDEDPGNAAPASPVAPSTSGDSLDGEEDSRSPEPSEEPVSPQTATTPAPTPTPSTAPVTDEVLTVATNPDLRRLLSSSENYRLNKTFSQTYRDRVIEFDGNVAVSGPHGNYDTRFDFLIFAGDYSETVANPGPAFQFRDVNFYDLNVKGRGSSVGTGNNLHIVAEVGEFEARTGLFLLEPVSTRLR